MKSQFSTLFSAKVRKLFDTFFSDSPNQGDTAPGLRRALEQYAAELSVSDQSLSDQPTTTIPPQLEAYIKKVTLYAYRVTDSDIAELRALGYSDDDLFEITISATLGAGRARLEAGQAALMGKTVEERAGITTSNSEICVAEPV